MDDFTGRIYDIYCKTIDHVCQPITMGIHRSDYLVHADHTLKQVELNTIAASFSSLSALTSELHRYLAKRTDFFNEHAPETMDIMLSHLPSNRSGQGYADCMAKAFELYNRPRFV